MVDPYLLTNVTSETTNTLFMLLNLTIPSLSAETDVAVTLIHISTAMACVKETWKAVSHEH
jgi:hypothetical protein